MGLEAKNKREKSEQMIKRIKENTEVHRETVHKRRAQAAKILLGEIKGNKKLSKKYFEKTKSKKPETKQTLSKESISKVFANNPKLKKILK